MTGYSEIARKAKFYGIENLTNAELLTLVVRDGKRDVSPKMVCEEMTSDDGLYSRVAKAKNLGDINSFVYGKMTERQELAVLSAVEIGKRIYTTGSTEQVHIASPADAAQYMMGYLRHEPQEIFVVVLLNSKNRVTGMRSIAKGSLTSAVVHPREVLSPAVSMHAAAIIVFHNHPSGNPYPSAEDRNLTKALDDACDVLGIPLMDSLVIGDGRYYSFKEHGDL